MPIRVVVGGEDEVVLVFAFLGHSPQVAALETRLKHKSHILSVFGDVVGEHIHAISSGVLLASVGAWVFGVVDNQVEERLGKHDVLHFLPQGLLQDILLRDLDGLVGIVGGQQLGTARQEYIIGDAG